MADSDAPTNKRLRLDAADMSESDDLEDLDALNSQKPSDFEENKAPDSLLCLNDDCLLNICEYLDVESLCNVADICKRLRPIAERAFPKRHRSLYHYEGDRSTFNRAIRKFGLSIKSIRCMKMRFDFDINAIDNYCPGLEELSIVGQVINCNKMNSLFSRMKILDFDRCEFVGNQTVAFSKCLQLFALRMEDCNLNGITVNTFPKLEHLTLVCSVTNCRTLLNFLSINPQIQRFNFNVELDSNFAPIIAQFPEHIELLLTLRQYNKFNESDTEAVFRQMSKLNLKELNLHIVRHVFRMLLKSPLFDMLLKEKVHIVRLGLSDLHKFDDIKSILKLKTLKYLHLIFEQIEGGFDQYVESIATGLPSLLSLVLFFIRSQENPLTADGLVKLVTTGKQLENIRCRGIKDLKINQEQYEAMLKAVQSRQKKKKLCIHMFIRGASVDVPESIQQANREQLEINLYHNVTVVSSW